MLLHKMKLTAMSFLLMAAVATGAGWLAHSLAMKEEPVKTSRRGQWRASPPDAAEPNARRNPTPRPRAG